MEDKFCDSTGSKPKISWFAESRTTCLFANLWSAQLTRSLRFLWMKLAAHKLGVILVARDLMSHSRRDVAHQSGAKAHQYWTTWSRCRRRRSRLKMIYISVFIKSCLYLLKSHLRSATKKSKVKKVHLRQSKSSFSVRVEATSRPVSALTHQHEVESHCLGSKRPSDRQARVLWPLLQGRLAWGNSISCHFNNYLRVSRSSSRSNSPFAAAPNWYSREQTE